MGRAARKEIINDDDRKMALINKIYKSFEALEETLGKLQLEEPLFMTYMAKKSFADCVFMQVKHHHDKTASKRLLN